MLKDHNTLLAEAYTELNEDLKLEISKLEEEYNSLELGRLKKMITNDIKFFLNEEQDKEGYEKLSSVVFKRTDEIKREINTLVRVLEAIEHYPH